MAHSLRGRFPVRTQSRRKVGWGVGPKSNTSGAAVSGIAATGPFLGLIGATPTSDGITLVRLRGQTDIFLQTSDALNSGFHGAIGVGIATDAAVAVGVTAVPTPITEETWDGWLWHHYFSLTTAGAISAAGAALSWSGEGESSMRIEVDSKAMRKIAVAETIYCAIEVIEVGAATLSWSFNSRTLSKLP